MKKITAYLKLSSDYMHHIDIFLHPTFQFIIAHIFSIEIFIAVYIAPSIK